MLLSGHFQYNVWENGYLFYFLALGKGDSGFESEGGYQYAPNPAGYQPGYPIQIHPNTETVSQIRICLLLTHVKFNLSKKPNRLITRNSR